uniref:Uncharacterized protein n=1 Tax=Cannabis sativa TaxID=3483 RepID=A0A803QRP3_CANSA
MPYFMEEKVGEVGGCVKVGNNIQLTAHDGKKQHSHQAEILEQEQMGVTNALIKCMGKSGLDLKEFKIAITLGQQ